MLDDNWDTVIPPPPIGEDGEILMPGTFRYVVAVVFRARCATCHLDGNVSGNLNLGDYDSVRAKVLNGGDPLADHILTRINSVNDNNRMPPPAADPNDLFPTVREIQAIQEWIDRGAPND